MRSFKQICISIEDFVSMFHLEYFDEGWIEIRKCSKHEDSLEVRFDIKRDEDA